MTAAAAANVVVAVGDRVERCDARYPDYIGQIGYVCEIDEVNQRMRVRWARKKTWIPLGAEGTCWRRPRAGR